MTVAPRPMTGRCLCGGVTYRVDAEPVAQAVCQKLKVKVDPMRDEISPNQRI